MNYARIKEILFPYGNKWLYIPCLVWILAICIFYITLPSLLFSAGERYEQITGVVFDPTAPLIDLSGQLYGVAFNLTRFFILFLIASAIFDGIEEYNQSRRKRGYL